MIYKEWQESKGQLGEMFSDAITTFVEETGQLTDALAAQLGEADVWSEGLLNDTLRKLHTLKGTTGQLGFSSLATLIHTVEDDLLLCRRAGRLPEAQLLVALMLVADSVRATLDILAQAQPSEAALTAALDATKTAVSAMKATPSDGNAAVSPAAALATTPTAGPSPQSAAPAETSALALAPNDFEAIFRTLRQNLDVLAMPNAAPPLKAARVATEAALFALIKARVVSAKTLVARLRKLVTATAQGLGKTVDFKMEGFGAQIDRQLAQSLSEILTHMLRNSLDHAIEPQSERTAKNKAANGRIDLIIASQGDRTLVTVRDDGRGIDGDAIAKKAVSKGLLTPDQVARMTTYERQELIFLPSFSTKEQVTEVSGRGVGMDAVQAEVLRLGGKLTFTSTPGLGSEFQLEFPSPYQLEAMVRFRLGARVFALPAKVVRALITCVDRARSDFGAVNVEGFADTFMQIELRELEVSPRPKHPRPIILLELAGSPVCLAVDEIYGTASQLLSANDRHPDLPSYVNGVGDDAALGPVLGIDCTELERNLNRYMQSDDVPEEPSLPVGPAAAVTPLDPHAQETQGDLLMFDQVKLGGRLTSKSDIHAALDGAPLMQGLGVVLGMAQRDPELHTLLIETAAREIDVLKDTIASVDDEHELNYLIAIRYASLKSNWILLNIQMQYEVASGKEVRLLTSHTASILSLILGALEPLTNPEAVRHITQVLSAPLVKAA